MKKCIILITISVLSTGFCSAGQRSKIPTLVTKKPLATKSVVPPRPVVPAPRRVPLTPPARPPLVPSRTQAQIQQQQLTRKREDIKKLQAKRALLLKEKEHFTTSAPRVEGSVAKRTRLARLEIINKQLQALQKQLDARVAEEKNLALKLPRRTAASATEPLVSALRPATPQEREREEKLHKFQEQEAKKEEALRKATLENDIRYMQEAEKRMYTDITNFAKTIQELDKERMDRMNSDREQSGNEQTAKIIAAFAEQQEAMRQLLDLRRRLRPLLEQMQRYQPRSTEKKPTGVHPIGRR